LFELKKKIGQVKKKYSEFAKTNKKGFTYLIGNIHNKINIQSA